jgi:hypothetical protein
MATVCIIIGISAFVVIEIQIAAMDWRLADLERKVRSGSHV